MTSDRHPSHHSLDDPQQSAGVRLRCGREPKGEGKTTTRLAPPMTKATTTRGGRAGGRANSHESTCSSASAGSARREAAEQSRAVKQSSRVRQAGGGPAPASPSSSPSFQSTVHSLRGAPSSRSYSTSKISPKYRIRLKIMSNWQIFPVLRITNKSRPKGVGQQRPVSRCQTCLQADFYWRNSRTLRTRQQQ